MAPKMKHAKGERLNIRFNSKIKLEFHGARDDVGILFASQNGEYTFNSFTRFPHSFFAHSQIELYRGTALSAFIG